MREQTTMIARAACLSLALILAGTAANAQDAPASPPPSAAPSPVPSGFSGRAHITLSLPIRGSTMTVGARVAVAQRDQLTRVDLLSVDASMLPIQIPQLTFVLNRRTNAVTVWNAAAQVYHTQSFLPAGFGGPARPAPAPGAMARPSRPERSVLASLDLLTFDMRLTGHTTTAGIASTGLAFDMKIRQHEKTAVSHVTGSLQMADDFAFFPIALQAHVQVSAAATPAVLSYLVDSFDRQLPPAEMFVLPDGYREAPSLLGVFSGIARRTALPSPSPSPSSVPPDAASAMPAGSPAPIH